MTRLYKVFILFVILSGILSAGGYFVWKAGYNAHAKETSDIKDAADKEDKSDVKTIIKWREKEKVVYRDKIKYIDSVEDPTNCADVKYTDMGFRLQ